MKYISLGAVLVAALFFCAKPPAFALINVPEPPAKYVKPYKGKLILHNVDERTLSAWSRCTPFAYACAFMHELPGKCTVWMPAIGTVFSGGEVVTAAAYKRLLRHEMGHCNGWPPSHPKS
jgi:hypothetical protein